MAKSNCFIFIPIPTKCLTKDEREDLYDKANKIAQRIKNNNRHVQIIWAYSESTEKQLASLNANTKDRLYISAHGDGKSIGTSSDRIALTPKKLAKILATNGLPKQFNDIRVYSCHSAQIYDEDEGAHQCPQNISDRNKTFIGLLKNSLLKLGYNHVIVKGYMGSIQYVEKRNHKTEGPFLGAEELFNRAKIYKTNMGRPVTPGQCSLRVYDKNGQTEQKIREIEENNRENMTRRLQLF